VSDSERWKIGAGVSYENGQAIQHVYVKPDDPGISASLIINTDRRVYHLIVRSYGAERNVHMPMVRWRYPGNAMPYAVAGAPAGGNAAPGGEADPAILADPRFLSFDYRITYPLFRKPRWTPELVYDDGKKTYVTFPGGTLQGELPAVFENRADVVNYRVIRDIIVIDRLVEALTVRIGNQSVIVRKRGRT
jgi:type IV secretion system protein VirB9